MSSLVRWFAIGGIAAAVIVAVAVERHSVDRARIQLELSRRQQREWLALAAENALRRKTQASAEEAARLAEGAEELPRLREQVAGLRAKLLEPARVAAGGADAREVVLLPAGEWRNAGRATPRAAVETALWAALGGDVDALAHALVLEPAAQVRAEQLLANLPEESRRQYTTPERLIALLAARDVPAGATMAEVSAFVERGPDEASTRVRLQEVGGAAQTARLTLRRDAGGWRIAVSERAVDKYAAGLRESLAAGAK